MLLPSDEPSIARPGMWSVWMFTVPSLGARECDAREKDALNFLFIASARQRLILVEILPPSHRRLRPDGDMYYGKGAGLFDDGKGDPEEA